MTNEELVALIQSGEREHLAELWEQVEKFVAMQAGKKARALEGFGGVTAEDLYQSGYIALVAAADSYDPAAGCAFIGWLALALKTAFAEAAGYRTSRRDPLEYSASLDTPLDDESGLTLGDLQEDPAAQAMQDVENNIWLEQLRAALQKAMAELPAEQRDTLRLRYYARQTREQIAAKTGVYPETARQRELKALRALRRRRELQQFVELRTPYYLRVGVREFQRMGESAVERIAAYRERLAEGR